MSFRLLFAAFAVSTLAGCATAPATCNSANSDASLIAKMQCDHSGGYSAQIRQREQELLDARAENELFHRVYEEISAQQQATRQSLDAQRQQQANLQQSLNSLLGQLKSRHASKSQVQQQIATLEQDLQRSPTSGESAADIAARQQELKALQQKVSRLQLSLGYE
ncbi:hypothetical protein [Stutzerimonas stutzeri]|uniref:hypothetical protein n=1 Tax=Stutzerimonas stutzeri TaxID=316 RepID=UPI001780DC23|nr:hypothetical protein [Stutzerimonas stutzeri]MBD9412531.1 hypothetical protein [Stutzerimonas stutzeri]